MNKTDLYSVTEEQLLLRQLREGDIGSYETLFHRYYPTFFAFCQRYAEGCRGSRRYYPECIYEDLDTS